MAKGAKNFELAGLGRVKKLPGIRNERHHERIFAKLDFFTGIFFIMHERKVNSHTYYYCRFCSLSAFEAA